MKALKNVVPILALSMFLGSAWLAVAADGAAKPKPYPLKTCIVSGEKLGGMGQPYVFTNDNREIKLCCKGCLKDFNKDKATYIKKLEEVEKKAK